MCVCRVDVFLRVRVICCILLCIFAFIHILYNSKMCHMYVYVDTVCTWDLYNYVISAFVSLYIMLLQICKNELSLQLPGSWNHAVLEFPPEGPHAAYLIIKELGPQIHHI